MADNDSPLTIIDEVLTRVELESLSKDSAMADSVIDGVAKVRQSIENAIKAGATTDQIVEVLVRSGLATRR